ncbi:tripartite tricarboxylate transporter TctB family protein [Paraburkholderia silvatlantica]|uniref:Tripartite tricarboxylate transporter TctB family protein n=1 Tax=Paraburkholderia silvatlantica TaxID=321895 RepID=A0A2V4U4L9_9BURK|nr:tripartite tricarboxylate transporter TctB family protein [Paraburkholderia silvatlantica]PYE25473.1 tripartite tricarboxylate transporter TctB family protein [Paraburkholderia silvatlantica]
MRTFARRTVRRKRTDFFAGALMIAIGATALVSGSKYQIGSLQRMDPGFFPVVIACVLLVTGLLIVAFPRPTDEVSTSEAIIPWRGWLAIVASMISFVVLARYGGLLPAAFAIVFCAAMGDRNNRIRDAVWLAVGMSSACVVIFWWALGLQLPLFRWGY